MSLNKTVNRLLATTTVLAVAMPFLSVNTSANAQSIVIGTRENTSLTIPAMGSIERQVTLGRSESVLVSTERRHGLNVSISNDRDGSVVDGTNGVILAPPTRITYRIRLTNNTNAPIQSALRLQNIDLQQ